MEVVVAIFLGFEKCSCIQFLTLVEYNKKGLTYVKLTHKVYKHKKNHIKIMNVQFVMDFTILAKQNVTNIKSWIDFYLTMCLCNYVKLWDIKYMKFRTLKVHLMNETLFQLLCWLTSNKYFTKSIKA
jgi:hypothetical protein